MIENDFPFFIIPVDSTECGRPGVISISVHLTDKADFDDHVIYHTNRDISESERGCY